MAASDRSRIAQPVTPSAASGASQSPVVDYAPVLSPRERALRIVRRAIILLAPVVLLGGLCMWIWLLRDQIQMAHWQQQCLNFRAPADAVAYSDHGYASATLNTTGKYFSPIVELPELVMWMFEPFHQAFRPRPMDDLTAKGECFLHRRRAAGGEERLVVMRVYVTPRGDSREVSLFGKAFIPSGRFLSTAALRPAEPPTPGPGYTHFGSQKLRVYFGQPDPADASHFTVGYTLDDVPGTIDGWLMRDDSVKLSARDGPLKGN